MAFSNEPSLVGGIFQRVATSPVESHWNVPMDVQWHGMFPWMFNDMDSHMECSHGMDVQWHGCSNGCSMAWILPWMFNGILFFVSSGV